MGRIDNWLEFWGKITPAMLELGQTIFRQTRGDPGKAVAEIRRIQDHWGASYQQAEDEVDAQLDALERKQAQQPAEPQPTEAEPQPTEAEPQPEERTGRDEG